MDTLQMWIGTVGLAIAALFVILVTMDVVWHAIKPGLSNAKRRLPDRLLWREPDAPHDVADKLGALAGGPVFRGEPQSLTDEQREAERKRIFQLVHGAKERGPARIAHFPFPPRNGAA